VTGARPLVAALAAVAVVLGVYLALGGASYEPTPTANPCVQRPWRDPGNLQAVLEQVALSGLDGAACELHVSREELVLALRNDEAIAEFSAEHGIARKDAEAAVRDGLLRAVDDAHDAGALSGLVASVVRRGIETVPPSLILDTLKRLRGLVG
jgi:hypothetical protein